MPPHRTSNTTTVPLNGMGQYAYCCWPIAARRGACIHETRCWSRTLQALLSAPILSPFPNSLERHESREIGTGLSCRQSLFSSFASTRHRHEIALARALMHALFPCTVLLDWALRPRPKSKDSYASHSYLRNQPPSTKEQPSSPARTLVLRIIVPPWPV